MATKKAKLPSAVVSLLESTSWNLFLHSREMARYSRGNKDRPKVAKRLQVIAKKMDSLADEFSNLANGDPSTLE